VTIHVRQTINGHAAHGAVVHPGAELTVRGVLEGPVHVRSGGLLWVYGTAAITLVVDCGARAVLSGTVAFTAGSRVHGSVDIAGTVLSAPRDLPAGNVTCGAGMTFVTPHGVQVLTDDGTVWQPTGSYSTHTSAMSPRFRYDPFTDTFTRV
jgi:hypothetical protein